MSQKNFMGAEDAVWMENQSKNSTSIYTATPIDSANGLDDYQKPHNLTAPTSSMTDVIISGYENKISQNIASKTLSASKRGKSPEFTKEEILYLNKKCGEENDSELKVITPTPLVTLKKGKTELNIGHALDVVKKMEEKYPTSSQSSVNNDDIETAKTLWKQAKVYNEKNELTETIDNPDYVVPRPEIKTVNRNAYEIRESVLAHALNWIQYTQGFKSVPQTAPTEDDVLNVAQKFYKFVENRK